MDNLEHIPVSIKSAIMTIHKMDKASGKDLNHIKNILNNIVSMLDFEIKANKELYSHVQQQAKALENLVPTVELCENQHKILLNIKNIFEKNIDNPLYSVITSIIDDTLGEK